MEYVGANSRSGYYLNVLETPSSGPKKNHIHTSADRRKSFNQFSYEPKVFNQQKNNKRHSDLQTATSGIKITTFEQCRISEKPSSTNSPFTRKNNNILRPLMVDTNTMSFRDLKNDKKKQINYWWLYIFTWLNIRSHSYHVIKIKDLIFVPRIWSIVEMVCISIENVLNIFVLLEKLVIVSVATLLHQYSTTVYC